MKLKDVMSIKLFTKSATTLPLREGLAAVLLLFLTCSTLRAQDSDPFGEVNTYKYQGNMNITAQVKKQGVVVTDATVAVYCGEELRGKGNVGNGTNPDLVFLTVYGDYTQEPQSLYFKVYTNGSVLTYEPDPTLAYVFNGTKGTLSNPYIITLPLSSGEEPYPTTVTLTDGTAFTGYPVDLDMETISYTRTFNNTEWQALYLPFAMSYSDWSTDFEMARINDVHQFDDDDDGTIDRTTLEVIKLKDGGTTKANTPYLIKAKSTGQQTITVSDTKLYRAQEKEYSVSSWDTSFTFGSTYSPMSATDIANWGYLVLGGGSLHPIDPAAGTLSSYRWYLKITDRDGNPKPNYNSVKLRVLDADGTTVLEEVELAQEASENQVYDLSGRRVSLTPGSNSQLRKGIYIINGKKVFVK